MKAKATKKKITRDDLLRAMGYYPKEKRKIDKFYFVAFSISILYLLFCILDTVLYGRTQTSNIVCVNIWLATLIILFGMREK